MNVALIKVIWEKSRGGKFLWNKNWDLGWIWAGSATFEAGFSMFSWAKKNLGSDTFSIVSCTIRDPSPRDFSLMTLVLPKTIDHYNFPRDFNVQKIGFYLSQKQFSNFSCMYFSIDQETLRLLKQCFLTEGRNNFGNKISFYSKILLQYR